MLAVLVFVLVFMLVLGSGVLTGVGRAAHARLLVCILGGGRAGRLRLYGGGAKQGRHDGCAQ
jgi:hypothetical protein